MFRADPLVFYLVHVLAWFLSDWTLIHIVQVERSLFVCHTYIFLINKIS